MPEGQVKRCLSENVCLMGIFKVSYVSTTGAQLYECLRSKEVTNEANTRPVDLCCWITRSDRFNQQVAEAQREVWNEKKKTNIAFYCWHQPILNTRTRNSKKSGKKRESVQAHWRRRPCKCAGNLLSVGSQCWTVCFQTVFVGSQSSRSLPSVSAGL